MINIAFPEPDFRIRRRGDKPYIFDTIRKNWLPLTEEEWVRQNLVAYFNKTLRYPKEAMAVEKGLWIYERFNRFDILVYDNRQQPWMLVECKAPQVSLNEDVLQQALRYHLALPARWIVISNGAQTLAWEKNEQHLVQAESFPKWGA